MKVFERLSGVLHIAALDAIQHERSIRVRQSSIPDCHRAIAPHRR
ncbi:MAG TPA: hypothetical protein VK607_01990 [Kofleriaceae bacterium]|nr:hypothetical protein [Kofleriaceae bacterium]HMG52115.1 hypothetical protein [Kofleriaceae bacterium]